MGKLSRFHSPLSEVDQTGASRELWPFIESAHSSGELELLALLGGLCPSKTPLQFEKVEELAHVQGPWSAAQGVLQELAISTDMDRTYY